MSLPSRDIPLQWYIYECVEQCPSSGLLGGYTGDVAQNVADGKTVLGSVINDPSQPIQSDVQIDYYNSEVKQDKYLPFFMQTKGNMNNNIFDRIETV